MHDKRLIEADNVSAAWMQVAAAACTRGVDGLVPVVVSVSIDTRLPLEITSVRRELDAYLTSRPKGTSCGTTANTIFPNSLWNKDRPMSDLFNRYQRIMPRISKVRRNMHGTYFGRMIAHGTNSTNQLKHIINTYETGNRRPSALQLSIFDPERDHTDERQRGFPCLQQVNFILDGSTGVKVIGTYAMQYIVSRAYGNYLGLCRLGEFFAYQTGRTLTEMTCIAPKCVLGKGISKSKAMPLLEKLQSISGLDVDA